MGLWEFLDAITDPHNDMAALSVQHGIKAKELYGVLERYLELAW